MALRAATGMVALLGITLAWLAVDWRDSTAGALVLAALLLLVGGARTAVTKAQWLLQRAHRWTSMLAMMGVVWIEAAMHLLNIPHVEGWWVPVLGGGGFLSASMAWLRSKRKS